MNPIGIQSLRWSEPDVYRAAELTSQAGADPSSPDAEVRERSVRLCCEAVEAAADAGSRLWGGVIYTRWMGMPSIPFTAQDREEMWKRGVESMSRMMRVAEREGVDVCFEIVNRFEGYLVTTAEQGIRFTEDIGSSRAKLLLDTFHMHIEEDSVSEALAAAMAHGRLGHVHAGEHDRHLPGFGKTRMNWEETLGTLKEGGYQGAVTLEPLVSADTPDAGTYHVWRDLLQDTSRPALLTAARQSIGFLRSKLY